MISTFSAHIMARVGMGTSKGALHLSAVVSVLVNSEIEQSIVSSFWIGCGCCCCLRLRSLIDGRTVPSRIVFVDISSLFQGFCSQNPKFVCLPRDAYKFEIRYMGSGGSPAGVYAGGIFFLARALSWKTRAKEGLGGIYFPPASGRAHSSRQCRFPAPVTGTVPPKNTTTNYGRDGTRDPFSGAATFVGKCARKGSARVKVLGDIFPARFLDTARA